MPMPTVAGRGTVRVGILALVALDPGRLALVALDPGRSALVVLDPGTLALGLEQAAEYLRSHASPLCRKKAVH